MNRRTGRLQADPADMAGRLEVALFFGGIRLHTDLPVAKNKRRFGKDTLADRVETVRCPGQQLFEPLELEPVDRVPRLGLDERKRNHPIEEEVIRVAPRARELRRGETIGERQPFEQAEVLVWRARIERNPLVADP